MEKQIRAYMCCGKEVYMKRISMRIRNAWIELRRILLSSVNSWWSVFKKKNAGILIIRWTEWLKEVCQKKRCTTCTSAWYFEVHTPQYTGGIYICSKCGATLE